MLPDLFVLAGAGFRLNICISRHDRRVNQQWCRHLTSWPCVVSSNQESNMALLLLIKMSRANCMMSLTPFAFPLEHKDPPHALVLTVDEFAARG